MTTPALIDEIAEVAGMDAALELASAYGGTSRYIPGRASPNHWLTRTVGQSAADRICKHFSHLDDGGHPVGQDVLIPMGPSGSRRQTRLRVARALANGASAADAARTAGVHERTAYRIRRIVKDADDRQGDLFD